MPCSVEWKAMGVRWKLTGIVTGREMNLVNRNIFQDRRFHSITYQLMDFTGMESLEATAKEVRETAFQDMVAARTNPDIKVAIVAPQDLMKKMFEIYDEYTEPSQWETRLFNTLEDANKWLKSLGRED